MYFVMLASRILFLIVLGLNLGVQDWKTKHVMKEVLQKSIFAEFGILMIQRSIFHDFRVALGPILMWILAFLVPKPVIWHAWWLHFGILGEPGPILGHWGAQERAL